MARPLLAAIFINGGINALRHVDGHVQVAKPLLDKVVSSAGDSLPDAVPTDYATLIKVDAGVKIGAGTALALGKFPRVAALLLAGSLVPTTLAGHAFWEHDDPQERASHQVHLFKNLGLLGGLLIAAADTAGQPSVGWRARRAVRKAEERVSKATDKVG